MRMTATQMRQVLELCKYPGYTFHLTEVMYESPYLVATYEEPDTETGAVEEQTTRCWLLNAEITPSELVQTAFKCIMTSMEHRTREWFTYRGRPVMQPHHDVEMLVGVCDRAAELRKQQKARAQRA